jgi:hypothetical protein
MERIVKCRSRSEKVKKHLPYSRSESWDGKEVKSGVLDDALNIVLGP